MKRASKTALLLTLALVLTGCSGLRSLRANPWVTIQHVLFSDVGIVTEVLLDQNGNFAFGGGSYWQRGTLTQEQLLQLPALPSSEELAALAKEKADLSGNVHVYMTVAGSTIRFLPQNCPEQLRGFLGVLDTQLRSSLGKDYDISLVD